MVLKDSARRPLQDGLHVQGRVGQPVLLEVCLGRLEALVSVLQVPGVGVAPPDLLIISNHILFIYYHMSHM
eukprot:COSAG01_NODE_16591_length_1223_cov_0.990214_1_plen_71_part_00